MGQMIKELQFLLSADTAQGEKQIDSFATKVVNQFKLIGAAVISQSKGITDEQRAALSAQLKGLDQLAAATKKNAGDTRKVQKDASQEVIQLTEQIGRASDNVNQKILAAANATADGRKKAAADLARAEIDLEEKKFARIQQLLGEELQAVKGNAQQELAIKEKLNAAQLASSKKIASSTGKLARAEAPSDGIGGLNRGNLELVENLKSNLDLLRRGDYGTVIGGIFGGTAKLGALGAGVDFLKGIAASLGPIAERADDVAASYELLAQTLNINVDASAFTQIKAEIAAIIPAIGTTQTDLAALGASISGFTPPDKIAETVGVLSDLKRIAGEGGPSLQDLSAKTASLAQASGLTQTAVANLAAVMAVDLKGKSVDPVGDSIDKLGKVLVQANQALGNTEQAAKQSAAVLGSLNKSGADSRQVVTLAAGAFDGLAKAAANPKLLDAIARELPKGLDLTAAGFKDGTVDATKFIDIVQRGGEEGKRLAAAVGGPAAEALLVLQNQFNNTGKSVLDFQSKFDNLDGAAAKAAAAFTSADQRLDELANQRLDNIIAQFGSGLAQAADAAKESAIGLLDTIATADFRSLGPLGGLLDGIRDLFIDSSVAAEQAFQKFNVIQESTAAFNEFNTQLQAVGDSAEFLEQVQANAELIASSGGAAGAEIAKIAEGANAADPKNLEKIRTLLDAIGESKAAETFVALQDAIQASNEAVADAVDEGEGFFRGLFESVTSSLTGIEGAGAQAFDTLGASIAGVGGALAGLEVDPAALGVGTLSDQIEFAKQGVDNLTAAFKNADAGSQLRRDLALQLNEALTAQNELVSKRANIEATITDQSAKQFDAAKAAAEATGEVFDAELQRELINENIRKQLAGQPDLAAELIGKLETTLGVEQAIGDTLSSNNASAAAGLNITEQVNTEVDTHKKLLGDLGVLEDQGAASKLKQLKAAKAENDAVLQLHKLQIAAIKAATQGEQKRAEAVAAVKKQEQAILDLKAGKGDTAGAVAKVDTSSVTALEAEVKVLEAAGKKIDKAISDIEKGGKRGGGGAGGGGKSRAAKEAEDAEKDKARAEKDRAKEAEDAAKAEKELFDKQQAARKQQIEAERKAEQDRIAAIKANAIAIQAATDRINQAFVNVVSSLSSGAAAAADAFKTTAEKEAEKVRLARLKTEADLRALILTSETKLRDITQKQYDIKADQDRAAEAELRRNRLAAFQAEIEDQRRIRGKQTGDTAKITGLSRVAPEFALALAEEIKRGQIAAALQAVAIDAAGDLSIAQQDLLREVGQQLTAATQDATKFAQVLERVNAEFKAAGLETQASAAVSSTQTPNTTEVTKFLAAAGQTIDAEALAASIAEANKDLFEFTKRAEEAALAVNTLKAEVATIGQFAVADQAIVAAADLQDVTAAALAAKTLVEQVNAAVAKTKTAKSAEEASVAFKELLPLAAQLGTELARFEIPGEGITTVEKLTEALGTGGLTNNVLNLHQLIIQTFNDLRAGFGTAAGDSHPLGVAFNALLVKLTATADEAGAAQAAYDTMFAALSDGNQKAIKPIDDLLTKLKQTEVSAQRVASGLFELTGGIQVDPTIVSKLASASAFAAQVNKDVQEMTASFRVSTTELQTIQSSFENIKVAVGEITTEQQQQQQILQQSEATQEGIERLYQAELKAGILQVDAEKRKQKLLKENARLTKKQLDASKDQQKDADIKAAVEQFQRVAQGIDAIAGVAETAAGAADKVGQAMNQFGAVGAVSEGFAQAGDLTTQVGQGLLGSGIQPLMTAGAVLLGVGLITKAIGKIIGLFKKATIPESVLAEQRAAADKRAFEFAQARLDLADKLVARGSVQIDQAREQLKLEQDTLKELRKKIGSYNFLITLSEKDLKARNASLQAVQEENGALLDQANNLLEIGDRTDIGDFLRDQGFSDAGSNIKQLEKFIDSLEAKITDVGASQDEITQILEAQARILELQRAIYDEQVGLIELRIRLGADELKSLKDIERVRRNALNDELRRLGNDKEIGKRIEDKLGSGIVSKLKNISTLSDEEVEDLLLTLTDNFKDSEISGVIAGIATSWLDSADAVTEYNKSLTEGGVSAQEALDAAEDLFEKRRRLLELERDLEEIGQPVFVEKTVDLIQDQIDLLKQREAALKANGAKEGRILDVVTRRKELELDIKNLLAEQNGELGEGDALLSEILIKRQKAIESLRTQFAGGTIDVAGQQKLAEITAEAVARLKETGATDAEIDAFLKSLPQFQSGGPISQTGPVMAHGTPGKPEYMVSAPAVQALGGVKAMDAINRIAPATVSSGAALRVAEGFRRRETIAQSGGINLTVNVEMNNQFAGSMKEAEITFLGRALKQTLAREMQGFIDTGEVNAIRS